MYDQIHILYLRLTHADNELGDLLATYTPIANMRSVAKILIMAARGELENALDELAASIQNGDGLVIMWCAVPKFTEIFLGGFPEVVNHPRFAQILDHYRLDQNSLAQITIPPLPWLQD